MKKNKFLTLILPFIAITTFSATAFALPAKQNQFRLQTSVSKRTGDTAFSTLVSWRKGDSYLHRANGLIFVNGYKSKNPTSAIDIARKAASGLNGGINYDSPSERGVVATAIKGKAEFLISNKAGFDLSQITVRDYSNQELHFNLPNTSFSAASVDVAIDVVYSAAVEYLDAFAGNNQKKAVGGSIKVTIDDNPTIEIKTNNKSIEEIEKELAEALAFKAKFSSTPIYPNYVESKSRNYKPFDGGEIQLVNLNAKTITIDISDSGLGVLAKFKFPDANKPIDVANKVPYIFGFLVLAVLGYVFYQMKNNKEEDLQG